MSEELLVNVTPRETRVAVVENGMLQELHIERGSQRGVVGNIYKGKVLRVMPGMQAAFVDIGLDRAAFLHANDVYRAPPLEVTESEDAAPIAPPPITGPACWVGAGPLADTACWAPAAAMANNRAGSQRAFIGQTAAAGPAARR